MQRKEANEQSNVARRADTTVTPQLWTRPGANILSGGDTTESSTDRERELEQQLKKYQEKFKREKEERKKLERWRKLKTEHGRKVSGETDADEYERVVEYVKEQLFRSVKFITDERTMLGDWKGKGSVGGKVVRGMNIEREEADRWWAVYKPAISRGIADHRNIASVGVKQALKGMTLQK
jgi:predicted nuclease with TOPRIM domain